MPQLGGPLDDHNYEYNRDKARVVTDVVVAHQRTRDVNTAFDGGRRGVHSGHAALRLHAREVGMDKPADPNAVNAAADLAWSSRMMTEHQHTARDDLT